MKTKALYQKLTNKIKCFECLTDVNVPILHLSNTINTIQSQLYAKPLWLCKISNLHIHEY